MDVVVDVKGSGKGKYRFLYENENVETSEETKKELGGMNNA